MKDLDFDELDKAVNSLMATKTPLGADDAKVADATPPLELSTTMPSTTPVAPTSTVNTQVAPLAPIATVEPSTPIVARPTPASPLPTKRSGRFMDVVHPSSDMRNASPLPSTSRQGLSLTPVDREASVVTAPSKNEESPEISDTIAQPSAQEHSWPDPLDLHMTENTPTEDVADDVSTPKNIVEEKSSVTPPLSENELPAETNEIEPSLSPFLADTKVEKRPLGLPQPETVNNEPSATGSSLPTEEKSENQSTPVVQLPEELHSDLLAVESDTTAMGAEPKKTAPESNVDHEELSGPISIHQQYKIQPSSADKSHAAVYDNVAQPLAHPAKKKSSWLKIVVIILILGLFGAAGAALYFLDLL